MPSAPRVSSLRSLRFGGCGEKRHGPLDRNASDATLAIDPAVGLDLSALLGAKGGDVLRRLRLQDDVAGDGGRRAQACRDVRPRSLLVAEAHEDEGRD